jgi:hypothetical protein
MRPACVYHFSEDPSIEVFRPHVPAARPEVEPLVWAIDEEHAPLYWFPRDCPRVTFWAGPGTDPGVIERFLSLTAAKRVHATECGWLESMRQARLFVYAFDARDFEPLAEADGHWVSRGIVTPVSVEPVGDLLARHAEAGIELRITPSLWPLHDAIPSTGLRFSMVRMRNAVPR